MPYWDNYAEENAEENEQLSEQIHKARALLRRIAAPNVTHTEMLSLQEEARSLLREIEP